jgi:hydrogenase-4 component E
VSDVVLISLVALGLAALTVRRPAIAAIVIAGQTLLVGGGALAATPGRSTEFLVAALLLMARAAIVSAIAVLVVARVREERPHDDVHGPLVRLSGALALLLAMTALVPPFGLESETAGRTATALIAIALALVLLRRAAGFAVLAFLVFDNGIAVAAVAAPGAVPLAVEIGVAFDLVLLIAVAAVFQGRILRAFGTTDTAALRSVRD